MQPEKWQDIKAHIQDSFSDVEISKEKLSEPEVGEKEIVLFTGPLGKMKLEYITRPVVLDKVTHGSRRIGSETAVEYIYSEDEFTHKLIAYKWDEIQDNWLEMEAGKEAFNI